MKYLTPLVCILLILSGCKKDDEPYFSHSEWYGFDSERYSVYVEGKWGFIDRKGSIVIDPVFNYSGRFLNSYASIRGNWNDSVIDIHGNTVIKSQNYEIGNFSKEGLAVVKQEDSFAGYMDITGNVVVPLIYDAALPFYSGLGCVGMAGKWGYINAEGEKVIDYQYDYAGPFNNNRAFVRRDGKYGYINSNGELVIPYLYSRVRMFTENLAVVAEEEKSGFINTSGELVIDYQFDGAWHFTEGLATVKIDGYWGYIDKSGNWVLEPEFDYAAPFSEGLAPVQKKDRSGYIDKQGNFIIEGSFKSMDWFVNGLAVVRYENGTRAYLDTKGNIIYQSDNQYKKKSSFDSEVDYPNIEEEILLRIFTK